MALPFRHKQPESKTVVLFGGPADGKEVTLAWDAKAGWPVQIEVRCTPANHGTGERGEPFVALYAVNKLRCWSYLGKKPVAMPKTCPECGVQMVQAVSGAPWRCPKCASVALPLPAGAQPIRGNSVSEQATNLADTMLGRAVARRDARASIAVINPDGSVTHMTPQEYRLWLDVTGGTDGKRDESKDRT